MSWLQLVERASRDGERLAIVSPDGVLSYQALWALSDSLSVKLRQKGLNPLALVGHKDPRMLVGILAALKAGRPYIPLDSELMPPDRISRIVELAGASRINVTDISYGYTSIGVPIFAVDPLLPAYIIFTSGSTGDPKGVVVPVEAVESFTDAIALWLEVDRPEVWLNVAPWSFDLSVLETYVGLATGGTLVSISKEQIADPKKLFSWSHFRNVENWVSTPSFADWCLAESTFDQVMLPDLKRFLFCGEVLSPHTASRLLQRFPWAKVYNLYGPTEACCAVTGIVISDGMLDGALPVGRPFPSMTITIEDERGEPARPGERGEVIIMGPQVALGYLGTRSDKFAELEGQRTYRTGDWGRIIEDVLFVEGRMDRQVKVHGYRVELGEVEEAVRRQGFADVIVVQGPSGWLRAYVKGMPKEMNVALKRDLEGVLPSYMVPKRVIGVETFPLNANGKVDTEALVRENF